MRALVYLVTFFLLSGCMAISTQNITIRENSIPTASKNLVAIGEISSNVAALLAQEFEAAISKSLEGQGLLSRNDSPPKYLLSAQYLEASSPTWGHNTQVSVTVAYTLQDLRLETPVLSETLETSCVASVSVAETISILAGEKEDAALGYPLEGTPISAKDAYTRSVYAAECALRKTIAEMVVKIDEYDASNP